MSDQRKVMAKARRVKFDLRQVFPPDDPLSVPLLRLMMATDDARHLQKLLIITRETVDEANETERTILNGELVHLFRLLCGHLYEAGRAFRSLEEKCPGRLEAVVGGDARAKAALAEVRKAYELGDKAGLKHSFLHPVRQFVGFHYKDEKLREALKKHHREGTIEGNLILSEFTGLSRYPVTDHLAALIIADELGGTFEEFPQKFEERIGEAIALAGALATVVDHVLADLLAVRHPEAILEEHDDVITVPPLLQRASEQVEAERKKGGSA